MVKLPNLFNSSKNASRFLTLDIGSESVKCFAFEVLMQEEKPVTHIVGIGKEPLQYGAVRGGFIVDIDAVTEALDNAILKSTSELKANISDIIFGVSGDLCFGSMTTVRLVREKRGEISEKELTEIYTRIHEAAYTQALNDILERTGNSETDIELVTSSVVYTMVDGKRVNNAIGLAGKKMEIAMFTAFTPTYNTQILQDIAKALKLNILALGSGMYSLVKSLQPSKGKVFDCVIVDIGSQVTDVGIVFGGGIVATRSLFIGGHHITQKLSQKMGITYLDAETKKQDYAFGRFSEDENLAIQDHISEVIEIWLSGLELLFNDFTGVKTFPSQVYLVGGGAELPDIVNSVSTQPWTRSIPFKSPPAFSKLTIGDLPSVVDTTGSARALADVLPAALSVIYLELNGYLDE